MNKLEPKVKEKWVKALRSRKYKQTKGQLCRRIRKNGVRFKAYCCLGVLKEVVEGKPLGEKRGAYAFPFILPMEIEKEYSNYNDMLGVSFKEIADKIEKDQRI